MTQTTRIQPQDMLANPIAGEQMTAEQQPLVLVLVLGGTGKVGSSPRDFAGYGRETARTGVWSSR